ncbi:serine carboxypeptidase-like 51 [Eucalyptus grandis]|uniref:serine carboxypeptidase-like 51 n=1 Tax=Eucalyptus grandis TaxID=71139 RepID=UPI00192EB861|nr:serine carboxypeptidase-like 51 [Eucalyptus grandis]
MEKHLLFLSFLLLFLFGHPRFASAEGTSDGSEQWGYVEVRPGAHLFWWLYRSPYRVEDPSKPWPILLWHQGGPGASGVGYGNFAEIGPLDENLQPRNFTWLRKADLLFVDSPVATGFSYVDDESLVAKTDYEAAADLTTLLIELFNGNETLQKSPLYIFAESYGGKFASALGLTALEAIEAGKLKAQLGGVALGDSWISPEDYVFSWGPVLKVMSRIDENGLNQSNSLALKIQQQLAEGKLENATATWSDLERVILRYSNNVDFYNFMLDDVSNPAAVTESRTRSNRYIERTSAGTGAANGGLGNLMNGPIRKKLKVIPDKVTWQALSDSVFSAFVGDFMKPRIEEVDKLLAKGVNVTIYNGQLDLICATKGTEAWLNKLKWDGLRSFLSEDRVPLYCGKGFTGTKGFVRSYRNLFFYWILGAGHMVPIDQPCISLQMVGSITQSPSKS